MSWYPKELVTCMGCGERFATPIENFDHRRRCHVKRLADGMINFLLDDGRTVKAKTRNVVRTCRLITVTSEDGARIRGRVGDSDDQRTQLHETAVKKVRLTGEPSNKSGKSDRGNGHMMRGRRQTIITCLGCGKALYRCDARGNSTNGFYHSECMPPDYPIEMTYSLNGKECTKEEFERMS